MLAEDREAQEDELLALASIYTEDEFTKAESVQGGETRIYLDLPENFKVFVSSSSNECLALGRDFEHIIHYLPPLVLHFELPPDYPSCSPPSFRLTSKWLSLVQLSALCQHLDNLWEDHRGNVVLFAWTQFLKEETLEYLNIVSPFELKVGSQKETQRVAEATSNTELDVGGAAGSDVEQEEVVDERAVQDVESLSSLIQEILEFDEAQQTKCFNSKLFLCNICFCEKLGSKCMCFLECKHVYCRACLKDYFEIQIRGGEVKSLNCPEPKCLSVATPGQVKELVEAELFARYDHLLLQSTLDMMVEVMYCLCPSCQLPVMQEPGCIVGMCFSCSFAFCTLCRMTYHGLSPCKVNADKLRELRREYLHADEANKRFLEQRYSKRVIQKALEEMRSNMWLKKNSKSCPCGTPIQKSEGCNKMLCPGCKRYFC